MKQLNTENGFTLVEISVTIFIIVLISGIIFANYRQGGRQFALQRSANKLAQDIRRAQQMAMSTEIYNCGIGWKMKGYGINLVTNNDFGLLKVRCEEESNPGNYNDITIGNPLDLEKEVKIFTLTVNPLNIFFYSPDPTADLNGLNEVSIIICLKADTSKTKTIGVNKAGLIEIQ